MPCGLRQDCCSHQHTHRETRGHKEEDASSRWLDTEKYWPISSVPHTNSRRSCTLATGNPPPWHETSPPLHSPPLITPFFVICFLQARTAWALRARDIAAVTQLVTWHRCALGAGCPPHSSNVHTFNATCGKYRRPSSNPQLHQGPFPCLLLSTGPDSSPGCLPQPG